MRLRLRYKLLGAAAALGLAAAGTVVALAMPANAHGALQIPGSRTWLCYEDGLTSTGQIIPNNPACAAAIAQSGTTGLYNWFAVLRSDGSGRMAGFIPDGKLCSAGATNFDFSGFDLNRLDWPITHLTSGATIQFQYNKWAAHPGTFRLYITKDGWDQSAPLSWDDFETTPFSSAPDPPSIGDPGSVNSYYYWTGTLPQKTGRHLIYSVWQRSDSTETFYGCSDVVFDGGNGQVTGMGPGSGSPTPTPTRTVSPTPSRTTSSPSPSPSRTVSPTPSRTTSSPSPSPSRTPTPPPTGGAGCQATYQVTSSWPGNFQANVTVTAGSAAIRSWTVTWTFANGESISQIWNGTLSGSGGNVSVANIGYNGALSAGGSTSFGFLASGTPGTVSGLTCTST
ncbi:lytic polysaccharide monooxygenase [Rugosimonospora acidiphila]|uniref:Lytic polysaccharide monooxygenase n=1 Tax=Rugosimonospora acidiphila TaxID=556531 RepID=A0ABP9SSG7_9ACTN